jgi:hypothetical protein
LLRRFAHDSGTSRVREIDARVGDQQPMAQRMPG